MDQVKNILIVDDDIDLQSALKHALTKEGYAIRLADNLKECQVQLMEKIPDLILLDAMLPDGNGFEFIKELLATEHYKNIGVLLMSGINIEQEKTNEALKNGALLFTQKPIQIKDLLQNIRLVFNVQQLEQSKLHLEEKYNHFFINTSDVFFLMNTSGKIINLSKSYEEITGMPISEKIGKQFKELLAPKFQKLWNANFEQILQDKVIPSFEVELINSFKNPVLVDILLTKSKDPNTKENMIIGLIKDLRPLIKEKTDNQSNEQANERELATWDSLTGKNTTQTTQTYEVSALEDENSIVFQNMLKAYEDLIETAIEKRIYKSNTDNKYMQRIFANELGFLKAGPKELIHLHTYCYKKFVAEKNQKKIAFYHEESRMVLLTVMGYLVSFYKNRNLPQS